MRYDFKFGDKWLSSYFGVTTEKPTIEIAQQDFELIEIPGKSGSEYITLSRYKNVEFERKIGFSVNRGKSVGQLSEHLINWLAYKQGYQEFEDTNHPGMITYAVLTNFSEIANILSRFHTANLTFSRKPFWYLKSGLKKIEVVKFYDGIQFANPYKLSSEPLILIEFTDEASSNNNITLEIASENPNVVSVNTFAAPKLDSVYRVLEIDFEKSTAVFKSSDGKIGRYLDYVLPEGFSEGKTTVKISSGSEFVKSMTITPRWRCL